MRLSLVQHGEAKSEEQDPDRPITDRGASDVRRVAQLAVQHWGVSAERVVHSGKTRAEQTAEMWGEVLGVPVSSAEGLAPMDDPSVWAAQVSAEQQDLMLVGHLPHLGSLAALLLAGDREQAVVTFRQGGLVGLDRGSDGWSAWLVLPPPSD